MMTLFFTEDSVADYNSAIKSDKMLNGKYFHEMLKRVVYLPPALFEAIFTSTAHREEDVDKTIIARRTMLKSILS